MKVLIDASVLIGYINKDDAHHQKCIKIFHELQEKYKTGELKESWMPCHTLIEFNVKIQKISRTGKLNALESHKLNGIQYYPIDQRLLQRIQDAGITEELSKLGSQDAIYAAIAHLEGFTLVTLDNDFQKVAHLVDIY